MVDYKEYTDCINLFINTNINGWRFKSHPDYCGILEHVTKEQGNGYLFFIISSKL